MKGTLFSADFVKDNSGNLRLLELNTDTAFIANTLSSRFDFTSFNTLLSDNTITELVVIYKFFHKNFILSIFTSDLSNFLPVSDLFINTYLISLHNLVKKSRLNSLV